MKYGTLWNSGPQMCRATFCRKIEMPSVAMIVVSCQTGRDSR